MSNMKFYLLFTDIVIESKAHEGESDLLMGKLYGGRVEGFADGHDLIALMLAHLQGFQEGVGHSFQGFLWPRLTYA